MIITQIYNTPIKMKNIILAFNIFCSAFLIAQLCNAQDKFSNFADLKKAKTLGVDFSITLKQQHPSISIFAIHGGEIELGTSEVSHEIAGSQFNIYLFEGLLSKGAWDLHITSTNFDEPSALFLASNSKRCVSIHGYKDSQQAQVCIGGLDEQLKIKIFKALLKTSLIEQTEINPCGRFYATSKENIVNRCANHGVQIEMSGKLREQLLKEPVLRKKFANAIRKVLTSE